MARRGRPPVPTALKLLRGNPGRRPIDPDAEPQPERVAPRCPKHVQGEARREWRRKTRELLSMNVLTVADRAALERYCLWYAIGRDTFEKLNAPEMLTVHTTPSGYKMINPLVALLRQASEMMNQFDTEFGCSPVARTRIKVAPPKTVDAFEAYRARAHRS
jgi:P27 family predicted phage terminase small subunit